METTDLIEQDFLTLGTPLPAYVVTGSPEGTEAVGAALGSLLLSGASFPTFIAMYGDLGVGKTAFARGLSSVLAPGRAVRSPTFSLVNEYRTPGRRPLFHFDLYRIESEDDLYSIGYDDYLDTGCCVAEWCENIPDSLPESRWEVSIRKGDVTVAPDERTIEISLIRNEKKEATVC